MERAVAELGPLHGLVVSAGMFEGQYLQNMTVEFWDRTMAINVRGTFLAVRAAARHIRQHGQGGSIVFYTSTAGQRGSAEYSAYATSKGAQIMFMRSMAKELAGDKSASTASRPPGRRPRWPRPHSTRWDGKTWRRVSRWAHWPAGGCSGRDRFPPQRPRQFHHRNHGHGGRRHGHARLRDSG